LKSVEAGSPEANQYEVVRFTPNTLVYVVLEAAWDIVGPQRAGPAALAALCVAWVLAGFALAISQKRTISVAVLASLFVFNLSLYWGFLNFMLGYPVFVGWWLLASKPLDWKRWFGIVAMSAMLLWAHSLWFGFACLLFPLLVFPARTEIRVGAAWGRALVALSSMLPVGIAALVWIPRLADARLSQNFDIAPHWNVPFLLRVGPGRLMEKGLEGIDLLPQAIVVLVMVWLAAALWRAIRDADSVTDLPLLKTAGLAWGVYLFAPDQYLNTICFSSRWLPIAFAWMLLALPPPRARDRLINAVAVSIFMIFSIQTTYAWWDFEQTEFSGLSESLSQVPDNSSVLGLDFIKISDRLPGRPFLQLASYSSAWHGASTHFSFTEHGSGVVRYREKPTNNWSPGLEWFAERVQDSDFGLFEYVLVNLPEERHSEFAVDAPVKPMTREGRWRLYQTTRGQDGEIGETP
jgi:hypothetical protein